MGRPLNKRYFGNPAQAGFQITCTAWFAGEGSATAGAWIVKQSGSNKYHVTDGTLTGIMRLVQGAPTAPGQMQVEVQPAGSATFLFDGHTESNYDGTPPNGSFDGGTGHAGGDEITLSNGAVVTVDDVDGSGEVTEFTIDEVGSSVAAGTELTQTDSTGSGTGFSLTPGDANIEEVLSAPAESASRIKNRVVKTFEGNIYNWPSDVGVERVQADIEGS